MQITIYRRHWAGCEHKGERYHPRCGCSLWLQFNLVGTEHDTGREQTSSWAEQVVCRDPHLVASANEQETAQL